MTVQKGLVLINTGDLQENYGGHSDPRLGRWTEGADPSIHQGSWKYGELKAVETLGEGNDRIQIRPMGTASSSIIRIKKVKKNSGGKRHCG